MLPEDRKEKLINIGGILHTHAYLSEPAIANFLNIAEVVACNLKPGRSLWETKKQQNTVSTSLSWCLWLKSVTTHTCACIISTCAETQWPKCLWERMRPTCDAARRLEVRWSREGYRGHGKGVHLSWGLHRGCVLCWWSEVNLILKVVLKLLHPIKTFWCNSNLPDVTLSGCCAQTPTLKLISLSLQQVTQFTSNTTKATRAASDTTKDTPRDRDSVSPVLPPEIRHKRWTVPGFSSWF